MSREWLLLCAPLLGCSSPSAPSDPASTAPAVVERPARVERPWEALLESPPVSQGVVESPWHHLITLALDFQRPSNLEPTALPPIPARQPTNIEARAWSTDMGPHDLRPNDSSTTCALPIPNACGFVRERSGRVFHRSYVTHVDGLAVAALSTDSDGFADRHELCLHDGLGRLVEMRIQNAEANDRCRRWNVTTLRLTHDAEGGIASVEEFSALTSSSGQNVPLEHAFRIFVTDYEAGLPMSVATFLRAGETQDLRFDELHRFEWKGDKSVRIDEYDRLGRWSESHVRIWSGEYVRDVMYSTHRSYRGEDVETDHDDILLRRGPHDYVKIHASDDRDWDIQTEGNIETITEYVRDVPAERRRFDVAGGVRHLVSVDRLMPDSEGRLVRTETWTWTEQRVVQERLDGRDVYLLDCSAEPALESLVDPQCPPPLPLR